MTSTKTRVSDRDLRAYVARSLEPGDQRALEAVIAADPTAQGRLDGLRLRLEAPPERPPWFLPRSGWQLGASPALSLCLGRERVEDQAPGVSFQGLHGLSPGDLVGLRFAETGGAGHPMGGRRPVVVLDDAGSGRVVHPVAAEAWAPLSEWEVRSSVDEPAYVIEVLVADRPGRQRYIVVLPDESFQVDWSLPEETRWDALRAAVEEGKVPAVSVDLYTRG